MPVIRDPLLSVEQAARRLGISVPATVGLVATAQLRSLDRGRLVAEGRVDIPLIRESWIEAAQQARDPSSFDIDRRHGEGPHPAAHALLRLINALDTGDAAAVWDVSSRASRAAAGEDRQVLFGRWKRELSHAFEAGVATNGYRIGEGSAVAVRLVADPLPLSTIVQKPTPMVALGAVPFVFEDQAWCADLPLWEKRETWAGRI